MPIIIINNQEKDVPQELYDYLLTTDAQELKEFRPPRKKTKVEALTLSDDDRSQTPLAFDRLPSDTMGTPITPQYEEYQGRHSGVSAISAPQTIVTDVKKEILLKAEVEQGRIKIIINREQRADTIFGSSQGDHVTAYAALLQTICSVIDGEDVHEAPNMLYEAAKCFLDEKNIDQHFKFIKHNAEELSMEYQKDQEDQNKKILSFEEKQKEIANQFFPRELRKELTYHLRNLQNIYAGMKGDSSKLKQALDFLSKKIENNEAIEKKYVLEVDSIRDSIKHRNQSIFAQFAVEIGERMIRAFNKDQIATLPKLKKAEQEELWSLCTAKLLPTDLNDLQDGSNYVLLVDNKDDQKKKIAAYFIVDGEFVKDEDPSNVLKVEVGNKTNLKKDITNFVNFPEQNEIILKITKADVKKKEVENIIKDLVKTAKIKGSEGQREKDTMRKLRLINKLIYLKNRFTKDNKEQILKEFKISCKKIIKTSRPNIKHDDAVDRYFQESLSMFDLDLHKVSLKNFSDSNLQQLQIDKIDTKKIAELFNNLFDFKQDNIIRAVGDDKEGMEMDPDTSKIKIKLREPENQLYQVIARHINFMFIAFKSFQNLPIDLQKNIVDKFVDRVMASPINRKDNSQGWENWQLESYDSNGNPETLKKDNVVANIKKLCRVYKGSELVDEKTVIEPGSSQLYVKIGS